MEFCTLILTKKMQHFIGHVFSDSAWLIAKSTKYHTMEESLGLKIVLSVFSDLWFRDSFGRIIYQEIVFHSLKRQKL